jgi:hypothetical protein
MPLFFILAEKVRAWIAVVISPGRLIMKRIQVNPCADPSRACQEYEDINRTLCEEPNQIAYGKQDSNQLMTPSVQWLVEFCSAVMTRVFQYSIEVNKRFNKFNGKRKNLLRLYRYDTYPMYC